jgi:WWE domain
MVAGQDNDDFVWEYIDAGCWKRYSTGHQAILEAAYLEYVKHPANKNGKCSNIRSDKWGYQVNFSTMVQTNVEHQNCTQHPVQRRPIIMI